jgi:hypothetical protein
MNERIKELIKQHGINITIDGLGYGEGNVEGLAELIVRECASQVRFTDLLKCNDDSDGEILLQASVQLKQHFGVQE